MSRSCLHCRLFESLLCKIVPKYGIHELVRATKTCCRTTGIGPISVRRHIPLLYSWQERSPVATAVRKFQSERAISTAGCCVFCLATFYLFVQSSQSLKPEYLSGIITVILTILTWLVRSNQPSWATECMRRTTSSIPSTTDPKLASASYGLWLCCEPGPWLSVLSAMLIYPAREEEYFGCC